MPATSTPTASEPKPLFPLPVSDDFPEGKMRIDRSIPSETVDLWGHHAAWCQLVQENHAADVQKVSDHGPACVHTLAFMDGHVSEGHETPLRVGLATPYTHGEYSDEVWRQKLHQTFVELCIYDPEDMDGDNLAVLYVTPERARKVARALEYAADSLDGFDHPVQRGWA